MKPFFFLLFASLLAGCSTIRTAGVGDDEVVRMNTRCDEIPRVYSGVAYDICELSGTPNIDAGADGEADGRIAAFVLDAVADTVILPWTLYRQVTAGNIEVR